VSELDVHTAHPENGFGNSRVWAGGRHLFGSPYGEFVGGGGRKVMGSGFRSVCFLSVNAFQTLMMHTESGYSNLSSATNTIFLLPQYAKNQGSNISVPNDPTSPFPMIQHLHSQGWFQLQFIHHLFQRKQPPHVVHPHRHPGQTRRRLCHCRSPARTLHHARLQLCHLRLCPNRFRKDVHSIWSGGGTWDYPESDQGKGRAPPSMRLFGAL
jgi:hypothetical protein